MWVSQNGLSARELAFSSPRALQISAGCSQSWMWFERPLYFHIGTGGVFVPVLVPDFESVGQAHAGVINALGLKNLLIVRSSDFAEPLSKKLI